jgi:hypothetical protein
MWGESGRIEKPARQVSEYWFDPRRRVLQDPRFILTQATYHLRCGEAAGGESKRQRGSSATRRLLNQLDQNGGNNRIAAMAVIYSLRVDLNIGRLLRDFVKRCDGVAWIWIPAEIGGRGLVGAG